MVRYLAVFVIALVITGSASAQMFREPPANLKCGLDQAGQVVFPDYGEPLRITTYPDTPVTVTQTPAAGTIFTGPQSVSVEVRGVDSRGRQEYKRFRVELVDSLSPSVTITRAATSAPMLAPGCAGHQYYIAPVQVSASCTASDACDAAPRVSTWHNGEPYVSGTPITDVGVHIVNVQIIDESGNETGRAISLRSGTVQTTARTFTLTTSSPPPVLAGSKASLSCFG